MAVIRHPELVDMRLQGTNIGKVKVTMDLTSAMCTITENRELDLHLDMNHSDPRVGNFSQFSNAVATTRVKFLVNNI